MEVFLFQVGFQKDEDVKPDSHTVDIQSLRSEDRNQQEEEEEEDKGEEEDAAQTVLNPAPVTVSAQSSIMYLEVMVTSLITLQPSQPEIMDLQSTVMVKVNLFNIQAPVWSHFRFLFPCFS